MFLLELGVNWAHMSFLLAAATFTAKIVDLITYYFFVVSRIGCFNRDYFGNRYNSEK